MGFFGKIKESLDNAVHSVTRDSEVKKWLEEISDAQKREKDWRKKAQEVIELYEYEGTEDTALSDFNILYANTETLAPAVYNNTPRPVVKRKIDKENPVAIAAAQCLKATLTYLTDTGESDKATFDDLQKSAVLEALVPGRGLARFYYDADIQEAPAAEPGGTPSSSVKSETICGDQVPWNRFIHGYAKNWQDIPWRGYEHFMTREELIANFGSVMGEKIKLTHMATGDDEDSKADKTPADAQGVKFAHVWEIWDKRTRKVLFLSEGYDKVIKSDDDPLGLEGFFDAPRPIMLLQRVSSLQPQTLYKMYEKQAQELEKATRRISGLLSAMRVRGFYDGTLEGLDELMRSPDNTLLAARNVAALQQGQSLEKAIWFMPLEALIQVLRELYAARATIINTIHQVTGIADIMRGASQASETLGAQKMKEQWGTMRLKRMQKEVQRFTRDCYRLQAELAAKHFGIETFKKMSGMNLPMNADKQQAQMQMQQVQAQMQQAEQMLPTLPPEMQQQAQQQIQAAQQQFQQKAQEMQKLMQTPSWEDVLAFLKQDSICHYIIDIETNSTIDIEATEDKQELAEMMNSMSQLMNGVFPMVKEGVLPFPAAKSLMLSVIGKFRMGDEVEETFRAMQQPQQQEDPAAKKVQAEMQRDAQAHELDMKAKEAELQQKQALEQQKMQIEREKLDLEREKLMMEREFAQAQHAMKMEEMQLQLAMKVTPPAVDPNAGKEPANANV